MVTGDLTHFLLPSSRLTTDVIFTVGDERIPAHKGILAGASPAFDSFFYGPFAIQKEEVMVEGVNPDTFTLFLHHNYGKRLEVSHSSDFHMLAELFTLANKFEDKEVLNMVLSRMFELVAEGGGVDFLAGLFDVVSSHNVTEVEVAIVNKLNQVKVREEDFPAIMQLACGGAEPRQKLLQHILARFLGKHCPTSHKLALFLAAQPSLNPETVVAVLKLIPEPSLGLPQPGDEEDVGRKEERREIVEEFLEFSRRFPRQFKEEMVDCYLGWKEDL